MTLDLDALREHFAAGPQFTPEYTMSELAEPGPDWVEHGLPRCTRADTPERDGKLSFPTEAAAQRADEWFAAHRADWRGAMPYLCRRCGYYHLRDKVKARQQRQRQLLRRAHNDDPQRRSRIRRR